MSMKDLKIEEFIAHYVDTLEINKKVNDDIYKQKVRKYVIKKNGVVKSLNNLNEKPEDIEFCKFKLRNTNNYVIGVYIWIVDNEIRYIGKTKNLNERFNSGYGNISPRNIAKGGQSTNCKMNRFALKNINKKIDIYFIEADNDIKARKIEKDLLEYNQKNKKWNLENIQKK